MDKIKDSLNDSAKNVKYCKQLRCAVAETSIHKLFWVELVQALQSLELFNEENNRNWRHNTQKQNSNNKKIYDLTNKLLHENITENINTYSNLPVLY